MMIDEAIKMFEENADECQRVADTQELGDGHYVSELYCDDTDAINDHLERCRIQAKEQRQLAEWLKELKKYKQAFEVACELLDDCILYGYDTERIFEIMMDKDGVVDAESYQKFILEHLSELRGEEWHEADI